MFKIKNFIILLAVLVPLNIGFLAAEGNSISGIIDSVGNDYIMINGKKIICDNYFIQKAYFEAGDNVEVMIEETKDGIKAVDYEYIGDSSYDTDSSE